MKTNQKIHHYSSCTAFACILSDTNTPTATNSDVRPRHSVLATHNGLAPPGLPAAAGAAAGFAFAGSGLGFGTGFGGGPSGGSGACDAPSHTSVIQPYKGVFAAITYSGLR